MSFDLGALADIAWVRDKLTEAYGPREVTRRSEPVGQLVRSLISGRTYDDVSEEAYAALVQRFPRWSDLAKASPEAILSMIEKVNFAENKARWIGQALRQIAAEHPDYNLNFLRDWPIDEGLAWLERLPGVGPKVAAATLNFSRLERPIFVVDTHVLRILQRFGFIGPKGDADRAARFVTAATIGSSADELVVLHALLKILGQTNCRAYTPYCERCPIAERCATAKRALKPAPHRSPPPASRETRRSPAGRPAPAGR